MEQWQREHLETIAEHRRQGFGWRYGDMKAWTSEAIFDYLRGLGIDADAGRFAAQAGAAGRVRALVDQWTSQITVALEERFARDFPLIAVPILWERLTPDLLCPEIISKRLYQAILAGQRKATPPDVDGVPADVAAALGLIRYLQKFPPSERRKEFDKVSEDLIYNYAEWVLTVVECRGDQYPEVMLEIADVMADGTASMGFQHEAAMILAGCGKRQEAIERTEKTIEQFGDDPWAWIFAGDVYATLGDEAEAIRHFTAALAQEPEVYDWEAAADRLRDICQSPEQKAELAEILRRYPDPRPRPVAPPRPAPAIMPTFPRTQVPPALARPARKVGRNDPCPCGSGKKYKKCCLLP